MTDAQVLFLAINLESSVERREYLQAQGQQLGVNIKFVPAVAGSQLTPAEAAHYRHELTKRYHNYELTPNEIACALSHRKALGIFLNSPATYAVLLEDDAHLHPHFCEAVHELAECWQGWQIAKLYIAEGVRTHRLRRRTPQQIVCPVYSRKLGGGCVATMYTKEAAAILYRELETIWLPVDSQIYQIILNLQLRCIGIEPTIAHTSPHIPSDIAADKAAVRGRAGKRSLGQYLRYRLLMYTNMLRKLALLVRVLLHLRYRAGA